MKLRTDSWIAKVARVNEKYITDECSLYRALVWELLVRAAKFVIAPVLVIFGVISVGVFAYEMGTYPTIINMPDHSAWMDMWSDMLGVFSVPLLFAAVVGLFISSMIPVAIGAILIAGSGFLLWEHVLVRLIKKSADVTAGNVVVTGIKNWHQGICRRVEFVNPNMPEGFGKGAIVLVGKLEGEVTSVGDIDHKRGIVEFYMDFNSIHYLHAYGEEDMAYNQWRHVHMSDIKVLKAAK